MPEQFLPIHSHSFVNIKFKRVTVGVTLLNQDMVMSHMIWVARRIHRHCFTFHSPRTLLGTLSIHFLTIIDIVHIYFDFVCLYADERNLAVVKDWMLTFYTDQKWRSYLLEWFDYHQTHTLCENRRGNGVSIKEWLF